MTALSARDGPVLHPQIRCRYSDQECVEEEGVWREWVPRQSVRRGHQKSVSPHGSGFEKLRKAPVPISLDLDPLLHSGVISALSAHITCTELIPKLSVLPPPPTSLDHTSVHTHNFRDASGRAHSDTATRVHVSIEGGSRPRRTTRRRFLSTINHNPPPCDVGTT